MLPTTIEANEVTDTNKPMAGIQLRGEAPSILVYSAIPMATTPTSAMVPRMISIAMLAERKKLGATKMYPATTPRKVNPKKASPAQRATLNSLLPKKCLNA